MIKVVSGNIVINEIMYNPYDSIQCPDANCEWIELYNNGTTLVELNGWTVDDNSFEDVAILPNKYIIIARELIDLNGGNSFEAYWGNNDSIWDSNDGDYKAVDGDFSLKNSGGDIIILKDNNGEIIDSLTYSDEWGADGNGNTLEFYNGNWYESIIVNGTPGRENSVKSHITQDFSNLVINEFFPDPRGDDNAPMPGGEFIELYNEGDNDTDLAGLYFKDSANHKIYITDTTTIEGTIIEAEDYLAVYMNGFSGFLNNEGFEEIRLYDLYGNLIDEVNYADSKEALSWSLVDDVWQYRLPTPNEENPKDEVEIESSFNIEGLEDLGSDNETEFGNIIKVKFHVYKGDTTKSSIKLYIENDEDRITKLTKAMLHNKFTNYSLTLPIPIRSNCNEKYIDGDYYVKVGWTASSEAEDSFKIKVEGINMKNCDKIYVERKPRSGTLTHNLVESPAIIEINKDFTVKVELTNNDGEDHLVDLYSYVYRGPKSYSGDRETNKKMVLVKAGQTKEFELNNIVTEAEPGDYKLKIKIKRDDQKTEKEITQEIKVVEEKPEVEKEEKIKETEQKIELKEKDKQVPSTLLESVKQPKVIYESTTIKAKKLVVFFLIGLLVVYGAVLTWRR